MSSQGQKRKPGTPGKFTSSGKPRANMIGNIGLSSQAKQHLHLDSKVPLEDGKEGLNKWELFRTYVKTVSGEKLTRTAYDDTAYRQLYERCASHAFLQPLKATLLEPQNLANQDIQNSLHWAIQDAWKKKRQSNKAGGGTSEVDEEADEDGHEHLESPSARRRKTTPVPVHGTFPSSPRARSKKPTKVTEQVTVQFRLLDPSEQPPNDYCGAAWADARVRWWSVINRGCSYRELLSQIYLQVPEGRLIQGMHGGIAPAPLVIETTPLNLAGCPSKDDIVQLSDESSKKAFWMLAKGLEKPVIIGVLCPDTANPPPDVVRLRKDIKGAAEVYEEIGEDDDAAYVLDPDHEGKEVRGGTIRERVKLRNYPTNKRAADRTLDTIMRRIIRQQRLYCVILTKVQERIPGYVPPTTDQESVLYYLDEYHKRTDNQERLEPAEEAPDAAKCRAEAHVQAQGGASCGDGQAQGQASDDGQAGGEGEGSGGSEDIAMG